MGPLKKITTFWEWRSPSILSLRCKLLRIGSWKTFNRRFETACTKLLSWTQCFETPTRYSGYHRKIGSKFQIMEMLKEFLVDVDPGVINVISNDASNDHYISIRPQHLYILYCNRAVEPRLRLDPTNGFQTNWLGAQSKFKKLMVTVMV